MSSKNSRPKDSDKTRLSSRPKQESKLKPPADEIAKLDSKINQKLGEFQATRDGRRCYPLLLQDVSIRHRVVDDVFDDLRTNFHDCAEQLDVIIDSSGGDIDSAYNLALLFRKFAPSDLTFFVARWAKSAATLLVCSGNRIMMSPIAELSPVDPQITQVSPLEQRVERFSPLHIGATLELIRDEFSNGNEKLAKGLLERLQFPLTLGSFKKSLDIGKEYLKSLLSTRMLEMLAPDEREKKAEEIAKTLTTGYAYHGFCINVDEAKRIGLVAEELEGKLLDIVWEIHKLSREKERIKEQKKRKDIQELLKSLPPELVEKLPPLLETSGSIQGG